MNPPIDTGILVLFVYPDVPYYFASYPSFQPGIRSSYYFAAVELVQIKPFLNLVKCDSLKAGINKFNSNKTKMIQIF